MTVLFLYVLDDGTPLPNTHFSVARTVLRSGASEYWLDDNRSSWSEVGCVLRAQGIDLDHNRFLILQGEVELIATMKPKVSRGKKSSRFVCF